MTEKVIRVGGCASNCYHDPAKREQCDHVPDGTVSYYRLEIAESWDTLHACTWCFGDDDD